MFFLNINHKINILNSFVKVWIVIYVQILKQAKYLFWFKILLFLPDANQENQHLFGGLDKYTQLFGGIQVELVFCDY